MGEWISIDDRLPDDARDVLGAWGDLVDPCYYRPTPGRSGWYSIKRGRYAMLPPSHWMEMPEAPSTKEIRS